MKNKQEGYEKLVAMPRNDDYSKRNLLDYLNNQSYYKIISIGLSRQTNKIIPGQINFTWNLDADNGATIFFMAGKQQKTILNFSLNLLNVIEQYKQWNNIEFFKWNRRF